jgi:hypothetical protein
MRKRIKWKMQINGTSGDKNTIYKARKEWSDIKSDTAEGQL